MHNVDIQIYPDKIQKLPTFLGIWFSRNSHVAFFLSSNKTRASRHLKRLDCWWVSSNHPPDCWALRTSQAGKICLVSSTGESVTLPKTNSSLPENRPKPKGKVVFPTIAAIWSKSQGGRGMNGDEWGSMDQQTNNSHGFLPIFESPLKQKIRPKSFE